MTRSACAAGTRSSANPAPPSSPTGSATVVVRNLDNDVEFTIENPIANGSPGPERFGLTGMRERVGLLGGKLDVGAQDGRFRVRALLPYDRTFDPGAHFDALADYLQAEHANR